MKQVMILSSNVSLNFFHVVLYAMKEDSEKVPTLLTDYILKGKHNNIVEVVVAWCGKRHCPRGLSCFDEETFCN